MASLAFVSMSPQAFAAEARVQARAHYEQAEAFFRAEVFDQAANEYQLAFELVPKPGLLFNVGLSFENDGRHAEAVAFYERYLSTVPSGPKHAEARARVAALERLLAKASASPTPPAVQVPSPPPPAQLDLVMPIPAPQPKLEPPSLVPGLVLAGTSVVVAGVATGFMLESQRLLSKVDGHITTARPPLNSEDPRLGSGKRSAIIADASFGVAGALLLVGGILTTRALIHGVEF